MDFERFLNALIAQNISQTNKEQGKLFEKFIKRILLLSPVFNTQFKEVYLWDEFSAKFNVRRNDFGIDLMALSYANEWISIQCKCFKTDYKIAQNDINNFLGFDKILDSKDNFICDITQKIVFHTCKSETSNYTNAIKTNNNAKSYGYYNLQNDINIDYESLKDSKDIESSFKDLSLEGKKELRDYQKDALNAITTHFLTHNEKRAKVIMACGTGKSLLSIRTIDSILQKGDIAVFFAPSLALVNQMLKDFFAQSNGDYKIFAVCSDSKVGLKTEDASENELVISPTTNAITLANAINYFLDSKKNIESKIMIFSTYQSIDTIINAQKIFKKEIKLIINDEAHRTAGYTKIDSNLRTKDLSIWQKTHDNDLLNAKFRLYMTATPKVYNENSKTKYKEKIKSINEELQDDAILFSMDDENIFGKEIYSLRFDKAVNDGILCDYRVLITYIEKESIDTAQVLIKNKKKDSDLKINADELGKMLGVYKALLKQDMILLDADSKSIFEDDKESMKRAIAFHSSIKKSKFLKNHFHVVSSDLSDDENNENPEFIEHIDGNDDSNIKSKKLSWLKEDKEHFRILSNAKCLTEGIDVPNLDSVIFFDPRDSVVDIIQAVGRAMRKAANKKYGYIILPILLSSEELENYDKAMKSTQYKGIWKILKALRSHDERLVDIARINEVIKSTTTSKTQTITPPNDDKEPKKYYDESLFKLNELAKQTKNAIPRHLGDLEYWDLYARKVGEIMHALSLRIKGLIDINKDIKSLFENFCKALQNNLNSSFDIKEALDLIAQHIIVKPIFDYIFANLDFSKFDKVSLELDKLYKKLCEFGLDSELKDLEKFYKSVQDNATYAVSEDSKDKLINALYDTLFKVAFAKTQSRLGIVYTPPEVIDFIIHSVEYALNKHFKQNLSDKNVNILDPFVGTGGFIKNLILSSLLDSNLEYKYEKEIWANEITLLGYYIAQVRITAAYHQRLALLDSKKQNIAYKLMDNLLFTDTFNTYTQDSKGYAHAKSLIKEQEYLQTNYEKIQEFKNTDFKIIIGNPPYSAGQDSANDNNQNTSYPSLESRIAETYALKSKAIYKGSNYDTYKMAIRYASDRIQNNGIIGFVTNGSFLDSNSDDGLRACLESEFDFIYILNLRGDARTQGEERQKEGGGIFDSESKQSVAICILVKDSNNKQEKAQIYYYDIGDYLSREDKLNFLNKTQSIKYLESRFTKITPNKDYDWINQRNYEFLEYMPLGNVKTKLKPLKKDSKGNIELEIFNIFSQGILTSRDAWCINFSKDDLESNMKKMIENYNKEVENLELDSKYKPNMDKTRISWGDLTKYFFKKQKFNFNDSGLIVSTLYRPFTKCYLYLSKTFNARLYQMPQIYTILQCKDVNILNCGEKEETFIKDFFKTHNYLPNLTICINGLGGSKDFSTLMCDNITEYGTLSNSQCFPLYYYEKLDSKDSIESKENLFIKNTESKENITTYRRLDSIRDEALSEFQKVYNDKNITKKDIFYYIYALLNHKEYKEKYKNNLSKMLPRIPFMKDFKVFVKAGCDLANLHLNYESFSILQKLDSIESKSAFPCLKAKIKDFSTQNLFATKQEALNDIKNLESKDFRIDKMRFEIKGKTDTIIFNDKIAIVNIPKSAYEYKINGKSALEWIMDRYQIKIDKDSNIVNNPNDYIANSGALKGLQGGKYSLNLLLSVIEMSIKTMQILNNMPKYEIIESL